MNLLYISKKKLYNKSYHDTYSATSAKAKFEDFSMNILISPERLSRNFKMFSRRPYSMLFVCKIIKFSLFKMCSLE